MHALFTSLFIIRTVSARFSRFPDRLAFYILLYIFQTRTHREIFPLRAEEASRETLTHKVYVRNENAQEYVRCMSSASTSRTDPSTKIE